jgi:hypothetical protein
MLTRGVNMNKIVLIILSALLFTNVAYATKYKVYPNINDYSIKELEVSSTENTKYQAKHNKVNCGYGLQNGKIYGKVKVNNKQILRVSSKKLTNGMLSFVNINL